MKNVYLGLVCLFSFFLSLDSFANSNPALVCDISSFTADYVPNSCEGEIITIEFDFTATDFGANGFTVEANGDLQSFNIGDPYMIYVISYCDEDVTLFIQDNDDPNCVSELILPPACCDCDITDPIIETTDCENGLFDLQVEFWV